MLETVSMFSIMVGLSLTLACHRHAEPEARDGYLELVVCPDATESQMPTLRLTISRLDQPFETRVELPNQEGRVVIDLRAGLYAVQGSPGTSATEAPDPVMPVQSRPALTLITPSQSTTLYILTTNSPPVPATLLAKTNPP